jgi:hypothetical protein
MAESNVWGAQRFVTLGVVVALHLVLVALLLMTSSAAHLVAPANESVEVLFFPPSKPPKVRFENARPRHVNADTALPVTLPGLTAPSLASPSSGTEGNGAAVNWVAEAHRAVEAVEIRRDHPPNTPISSSWTDWWPGQHRAGDRYKTESGDWIVWISASCYQIARWGPGAIFSSAPAQTFCPRKSDAPRGDDSAAGSKPPGE